MAVIFDLAFPFFAVIFAGLVIGRSGFMAAADAGILIKFVFRVAMPAALFVLMARTDATIFMKAGIGPLLYLACALLVLALSYVFARRVFGLVRPDAGLHAFASSLGNAVFLGLPIAQSVPGWTETFVVLMLLEGAFIITAASFLIAARAEDKPGNANRPPTQSVGDIIMRPVRNPLVLGTLSGLALGLSPFSLPEELYAALSLLGGAAGPTALFALGLFLSAIPLSIQSFLSIRSVHVLVMKMMVLPALVFASFTLAGLTAPDVLGPALLFTLVPTGVAVFMQAGERGRYKEEIASAIALTTLLSLFTITAVLVVYTPR